FRDGINGDGGGAISAIFGLPLLYWFGPTGAKVTMVLLIFVAIMLLTDSTLIDLVDSIRKPVKKMEDAYVAHAELRNQFRELEQDEDNLPRPNFNINIPVADKEAPQNNDPLLTDPEEFRLHADSFFNAKQKKEAELQKLRESQEATQNKRSSWKDKLTAERAEQKRREMERAQEISANRLEPGSSRAAEF